MSTLFKNSKRLKFKEFEYNPDWTTENFILEILRKVKQDATFTYGKEEKFQCKKGANRSVKDIYRIAKTYRPDIDPEEVVYYIIELTRQRKLVTFYCSTVRKLVTYLFPAHHDVYYNKIIKYAQKPEDEYKDISIKACPYKTFYSIFLKIKQQNK